MIAGEESIYIRDSETTPCKNSPLECQTLSHDPLIFEKFDIPTHLVLSFYAPPVWTITNLYRDVNEGDWSGICGISLIREGKIDRCSGTMGPCEADASSDPEASLELEVSSEPLADLGDVSVSVRSSSD